MAGRRWLFIFVIFFLSCTNQKSYLRNSPVLTVNGQTFTASAFGHALAKKLKMYDALAAKDSTNIRRAREEVIKEFIVSALLEQFAKAHSLSVGDGEVLEEFDRIRKTYPDDLTFKAALATEGQSIEEWKRALSQTLLQRKVFGALEPATQSDQKADEKGAREYYETHKDNYIRPAQIRLQQIVVSREDDAERIMHKLKSGISFTSLAQKFSISPDGAQGGDIGFISKGTMPAFDTAFNLKTGQTSAIVKSSYGFHIMKVLDRRPAGRLEFNQVKSQLIREATAKRQQSAFNNWLEGAIKSSKIDRNDGLLEKIRVRTEGEEE